MGDLTWYIIPALVLTVIAIVISITGFITLAEEGAFDMSYGGPDAEEWLGIAICSSLPFMAWLWPLLLGLILLALVLAVLALPFVGVYAGLRAFRAWKEEQ